MGLWGQKTPPKFWLCDSRLIASFRERPRDLLTVKKSYFDDDSVKVPIIQTSLIYATKSVLHKGFSSQDQNLSGSGYSHGQKNVGDVDVVIYTEHGSIKLAVSSTDIRYKPL